MLKKYNFKNIVFDCKHAATREGNIESKHAGMLSYCNRAVVNRSVTELLLTGLLQGC